jgi:hypothetical protein
MQIKIQKLFPIAFIAAMLGSSCNSSTTTTKEEVEIKTMDSTSGAVKENREKLEDQTKKVETSIEKLDNEFDSTTNK